MIFPELICLHRLIPGVRPYRTFKPPQISINGTEYPTDSFTNVTDKILSLLNRKLYKQPSHPLCLTKEKVVNFFYGNFKGRTGNPIFSVIDNLNPIVTTVQNFDSLLIPKNHVCRSKTDCYYVNNNLLLRSHMTAHQFELIKMGFDNFLMVGDVYRRDAIDRTHYPVFHQLDAVKLFSPQELFLQEDDGQLKLDIKERDANKQVRSESKQETYSSKASELVEISLKKTLEDLSKELFGKDIKYRWVDAYFPFTHPSYELEILLDGEWTEVLGCGIMEHKILDEAGCGERIGWAFGLGLERLAMILYQIPDIRLFWSTDAGFVNQFKGKTCNDKITFKQISKYPSCANDLSFWVPENYSSNDFYDLARGIGGDLIEQIELFDVFKNPKTERVSHAYRITYRDLAKVLTQAEANSIHERIKDEAAKTLNVVVR